MDVGADEFEQSLPLLQELVQGADFVGRVRGLGRSQALCAGGARGGRGGAGPGGQARPGGTSLGRAWRRGEGPFEDRCPSAWCQQQLPPWP